MLEAKLEQIRDAALAAGVSVSIGGCYCDGITEDAAQAADRAMYESKRTGKVVVLGANNKDCHPDHPAAYDLGQGECPSIWIGSH